MRTSKPSKENIRIGFSLETIELDRHQIMPLKAVGDAVLSSHKFRQIVASIREVGIIEPPVVSPDRTQKKFYLLLDGHLRLHALKELGIDRVTCLVSTDDEAFTYNKHVNRLSPVQEHRMILRAVDRGVAIEKIARALNVEPSIVVRKKNLLAGICAEAAHILKDKMVATGVFPILKRMKPYRQLEATSLMRDANLYSLSYAKALYAATPKDQLNHPPKQRRLKGLDATQMARMETEMQGLQHEYNLIQESYGPESLNLTIARTYIAALLNSAKVERYLRQHHPELLTEFQAIVQLTSRMPADVQEDSGKFSF